MEAVKEGEGAETAVPAGSSTRLSGKEWLLLGVLASVQFTHIVDFMIVMPLGPTFVKELGLTERQHHFIVAAYTLSAGIAGILAAGLLDRFDRKKALLTLYAGFIVGTLLCAAAPSYLLLLAARTVAGAFGGVAAAVVLAIVGDAFPYARRGTAMGVIMSAFSVASIAGVPMGLNLANWFGWHVPFAVLGGFSVLVLVMAIFVLPPLRGHLERAGGPRISTWQVFSDPNHLKAFSLTGTLVFTTFCLAPGMVHYLEYNVGVEAGHVMWIYVCGGAATVITLSVFGRLADAFGKLRIFRILAITTIVPVLLVTNLPAGTPMVLVLATTTLFMVLSSGRMVPAMALITASSTPAYRGSFMSLNAVVQHLASGLASVVAGELLTRDDNDALVGYPLVGLVGCGAAFISLYLAGRLRPVAGGLSAPDSQATSSDRPIVGAVEDAAPVETAAW